MSKNKSIILLSGGLDSVVSLGLCKDDYNIDLSLTFDYGQNSAKQEIKASKKIAEYYGIKNEVITLPFLKKITNNAFVGKADKLPTTDLGTIQSAKSVWVPNRNALFLNIAAAYADAYEYTHIIFGANKTEGQTFPDNTSEFVESINNTFKYSTSNGVKVFAPLINYDKLEIVKQGLDSKVPLEMVYSCYSGGVKNCGICESCTHLKKALLENNATDYIERLF